MISKEFISACFINQVVIILLGLSGADQEHLWDKTSRGTVLGTPSLHVGKCASLDGCTQSPDSERTDGHCKESKKGPSFSVIDQKKDH